MWQWQKKRRVEGLKGRRRHVVGLDDEQAASILWILQSYNSKNLMSRIPSEREIDNLVVDSKRYLFLGFFFDRFCQMGVSH